MVNTRALSLGWLKDGGGFLFGLCHRCLELVVAVEGGIGCGGFRSALVGVQGRLTGIRVCEISERGMSR
jgi:hypothetical protein